MKSEMAEERGDSVHSSFAFYFFLRPAYIYYFYITTPPSHFFSAIARAA